MCVRAKGLNSRFPLGIYCKPKKQKKKKRSQEDQSFFVPTFVFHQIFSLSFLLHVSLLWILRRVLYSFFGSIFNLLYLCCLFLLMSLFQYNFTKIKNIWDKNWHTGAWVLKKCSSACFLGTISPHTSHFSRFREQWA